VKICYISNLYPPFVLGGAEIYVRNIAEESSRTGNEVVIITTSPDRGSYIDYTNQIKIYRLDTMNLYPMYSHVNQPKLLKPLWHTIDLWNICAYNIVKDILIKERPDIVHIHNFKGFSLSVFNVATSLKIPVIFTAHDYSLICPKANMLNSKDKICSRPSKFCKIYIKLQRRILDAAKPDLVTAPSQFLINKLREHGFFENIRTMKLPLGIRLSKRKIEKNYDIIDILYVGNLSVHKGLHILIRAFRKLQYENIKLHVVGKGKDVEKFKRLAGNDSRIRFYGFVSENELRKLYNMANVVVVPSIWYENSPVVIYESFMSGTPVIGSRIGGIPELVEDGYNGLLFEAGNVRQLIEILDYLITSTYTLRKLEFGARNSIKNYDINKHIMHLNKIYLEELLCPKGLK